MCCEKALTEASRQAGDATICVECDTLAGTEKPVTGNPMNCRSLDANPGCGPNDAFGQVAIPSLPGRIERFGVSGTNGIERALLNNQNWL
jgi:hypothetical protein